jgi:hypothetical protein
VRVPSRRLFAFGVLLALALVIPLSCTLGDRKPDAGPPAADEPPGFFHDMTTASGVDFTYRNGEDAGRYAIIESLGGGVAVFDYDGDGLPDLFFPGGGYFDGPDKKQVKGYPPKLYRNLGNWKFEDVTAAAGLADLADGQAWFYSHGAAVTDYDRDGFPDLLMTGYGRVALWHNEPGPNGTRRFREVTKEAGLLRPGHFWSSSAAFGDLDGDGFPDLYLCQYVDWSNANDPVCPGYYPGIPRDVCPPKQFGAVPHALYRNLGNGKFEDVTAAAGLRVSRPDKDYGKGLGVLFVDVDHDGKPDIYVANDTTKNLLFLNRSEPGRLRFEDRGDQFGVHVDDKGKANGSMGLDAADYDGSGRPSIWVTNYENELHALYRNQAARDGRMYFTYSTSVAGLAVIGQRFVGFGTAFVDVDRDGWEDIVINNGHVMQHHPQDFVKQPPILFLNTDRNGQRFFVEDSAAGGPYFRASHRGRGLAVGDLDNDGGPDFVFCNLGSPVALLRNEAAPERHWLGVDLAPRGYGDPTGARLTLEAGGRKLVRFATRGRSYLSHSDTRLLFGLGDAGSPGRLTVEWRTGSPRVEHFDGLAADRYHRLEQGRGTPAGGA